MNEEQIRNACERDFQNGAGRAQLRNHRGSLIGSSERGLDARRRADTENGDTVWERTKVRGEHRYEWRQIAG